MFPQYCKELKQILQNTSFLIFMSVCKNFPSLAENELLILKKKKLRLNFVKMGNK